MPRHRRQSIRQMRQLRPSLLIVVEGATEFAFCKYLKSQLSHRNGKFITIKNAHGGSPSKIVEYTYRNYRHTPYDNVAIIWDTDVPLNDTKSSRMISSMKATIINPSPCIEGLFLEMCGEKAPPVTADCKRRFHKIGLSKRDKLDANAYENLFLPIQLPTLRAHPTFKAIYQLYT